MKLISKLKFLLPLCLLLVGPTLAQEGKINSLQQMMLFRSFIQDADACMVIVKDRTVNYADAVTNSTPTTCPDMFAWVQLAEAIDQKWWEWGLDQTVWPAVPWPVCTESITSNCCSQTAKAVSESQPEHCPAFRADYKNPSPLPNSITRPSGDVISHTGLNNINDRDPERLLRDLENELVFRNKPFVKYVLDQDLYSKEGLGSRNRAQAAAISAGNIGLAHRLEVSFPTDASMVKADFIPMDIMLDRKLIQNQAKGSTINPPNNPDYPYLTVWIGGDKEGSTLTPDPKHPDDRSKDVYSYNGYYYLVAMTNASKDLPKWHWYALEHVANEGRCDLIGCNDSYGYQVSAHKQRRNNADFGPSYVPPHITYNNDRHSGNDAIFHSGKTYLPVETGETISADLKALLKGFNIGTDKTDTDPKTISGADPAWMNYRMKGTQTAFYHATGVPTGMGASVTEGGFVNSASCMSCHAQASVNAYGQSGFQGVGSTWRPNLDGMTEVTMGAPNISDFYGLGGPTITATQIDFVWGILGASCQVVSDSPGVCARYPDRPSIKE
jgi:hypothetical protein